MFLFNFLKKKLKKTYKLVDVHDSFFFFQKIWVRRNRYGSILFELNYFYLTRLFSFFKKFKQKNLYKNNFHYNNNNILLFTPSYLYGSQFFENKYLFDKILTDHNLKGFFLYKNFFKKIYYKTNIFKMQNFYFGYNFYIMKISYNKYLNLFKNLDDKEFNKIGKVKFFIENQNYKLQQTNDFNFFLNYNLYLFNLQDLYRIIIYLNLNTIINKTVTN